MATLKYVGVAAENDTSTTQSQDLATESYVNYALAQGMTQSAITAQINTALAGNNPPTTGYATKTTAASLVANVATNAYLAAQEANYAPAVGSNLVPLVNGTIPAGLIQAPPNTQTFPAPLSVFPTYNTATVGNANRSAATLLYTVPVPDPGYKYYLMVTGNVDTSSAGDGTIPQILVRQGSATGQTVAVGYGLEESYSGPTPGSSSASAYLGAPSGCPGGWATIPYWTASTGSTVINNCLQAPFTGAATVTAVVNFSGAYGGTAPPGFTGNAVPYSSTPETYIRLYSPTNGGIVGPGALVSASGGTCVVSASISVTYGQLFTVQMLQGGIAPGVNVLGSRQDPGHFGTVSPTGSYLAIAPPSVGTTAPATIVPLLANQTPISGATTLYVMLQTSDTNNTTVYATATNPGLWVVPVPSGT